MTSRPDKGKGRDPTERTPLLPSSSESTSAITQETQPTPRRRLLCHVFLIFLAVCIAVVAALVLIASSYAAHSRQPSLSEALVFDGPYTVQISNMTSEQVFLNVSLRAGIDAGSLLGVDSDIRDNIFHKAWKLLGRWAIRRLDSVSVELNTTHVNTGVDHANLFAFALQQPLLLPLAAYPTTSDLKWLGTISAVVRVYPPSNSSLVAELVQESWKRGYLSVSTNVDRLSVSGAGGWRRILHTSLENIVADFNFTVPPLPGLPQPGRGTPLPPFGDLITLEDFEVYVQSNVLTLQANATAIDPAPRSFHLITPVLPFIVSLPTSSSPIPIAAVQTDPFFLTHPNVSLHIAGHVLPLSESAGQPLSTFLSNYLSAAPNPIIISSPQFPGFQVDATFPPPVPRPQILQNVTIHDMRIKPGNTFLASGTVFARLVLPKGIHVGLNVTRVLPDLLIFDGEVDVIRTPLPEPLPARAFGHIRPEDWVDSECFPDRDAEGSVFNVTAKIVDVPVEVLPGREKEFSNFVSKVIFSTNGAVAGIIGSTAVDVVVEGLALHSPATRSIILPALPFHGSVRIHKTGL